MTKKAKPLHHEVVKLLDEIAAYLDATGCRRTNFGLDAVGDGHFLRRIEGGRVPRIETFDRVRAFIKQNAPQQ